MIRQVSNLRTAERLLSQGYQRPRVWWSGTLVSVVVARPVGQAGEVVVPVVPRALGVVEGFGLATSESKEALARAAVDAAPKGVFWEPMLRLNYDRKRPGYRDQHWFHKTPGAWVALVRRSGERLASAYVDAPGEEILLTPSG